jgi:hypothetical protein
MVVGDETRAELSFQRRINRGPGILEQVVVKQNVSRNEPLALDAVSGTFSWNGPDYLGAEHLPAGKEKELRAFADPSVSRRLAFIAASNEDWSVNRIHANNDVAGWN